jgi:hypothetical protein
MAVSRYETRRHYVVTEANAIGTALLRAQFISEPYSSRSQAILRRYVDLRVAAARHIDYGHHLDYPRMTADLQTQLWAEASAAMRQDNRSQANALFVQVVNEVIDVYGERTDVLRAHVPGGVLAVLHMLAFIALVVVGYVEGRSARRHWGVPAIVALLISMVMTLIVDLDRPRQGLIETSQESMLELKASLARK